MTRRRGADPIGKRPIPRSRRRPFWMAVLLALPVSVASCGDDGSPGELTVRVESSELALGAAVVEITMAGIRGVEGSGSTRIVAEALKDRQAYRLVAVNPDGGGLVFRIRVDDVSRPVGGWVILQASGTDNRIVGPAVPLDLVVER